MISVLILTKNEELNLPDCLKSVEWSNDIVVFDSYSDDATCKIAQSKGARVIQREFDNYGSQREAARKVTYRNQWVLALDADERPEPDLVEELHQIALSNNHGPNIYRLRRKDFFMDRWIKRTTLYPSWFLRFYRPTKICYTPQEVHEYPTFEGPVGQLDGHLLHFSFNKGLSDWFKKHVQYAELEAIENLKDLSPGSPRIRITSLISFDPVIRRKALKRLSRRIPFRPLFRFIYSYLLRGGFLDGIAGYRYAIMLAIYESMIVLNIEHLQHEALKELNTSRKETGVDEQT